MVSTTEVNIRFAKPRKLSKITARGTAGKANNSHLSLKTFKKCRKCGGAFLFI